MWKKPVRKKMFIFSLLRVLRESENTYEDETLDNFSKHTINKNFSGVFKICFN